MQAFYTFIYLIDFLKYRIANGKRLYRAFGLSNKLTKFFYRSILHPLFGHSADLKNEGTR